MVQFKEPTTEQFFTPYNISTFSVSKDETKLIFSSNQNGKPNLYGMDLDHLYPYQLTNLNQSSNFIHIDKQERFILTGFDNDGDENHQIFALPVYGGTPVPFITGEENDKFLFVKASKDGNTIYYNTSVDNPTTLSSYAYDIEDDNHRKLYQSEDFPSFLIALTEDESKQVYIEMHANTYILGYVMDNGKKYSLTPDINQAHVVGNVVFTDDQTLYFSTDFDSDHAYLARYDIQAKQFSKVNGFKAESIIDIQFDEDNNSLIIVTNKGVLHKMYRYNLDSTDITNIDLPFDLLKEVNVMDSGHVYALGESATRPTNIYKFDGSNWHMLTKNNVVGVPSEKLVEPEVISYPSFDGLTIEALLFKADERVKNGYTIFWPHGGPQYAEMKQFRAMFQVLLNQGYHIFCPNFRGSTGYGSNFTKMVEGDWGHGPRLDNVEGVKWLFDNDISSPDKLFLVGGSYGGYMALLLHGRHPELFKAVIDIFGVSNLFTFYHSVPDHWKPIMKIWIGDPEADKEKFEEDSPITYLETMTNPMLVIQGAKDPRVVKEESDQIVKKLESLDRDIEYLILEDEGHGFSKKENEIKVLQTMIDFLENHQ